MVEQSGWAFPDSKLEILVSLEVKILGKYYRADLDGVKNVGDLVLDRKDGCYGRIDFISGEHAAVRDVNAVEIGIPLTQLIKLKE